MSIIDLESLKELILRKTYPNFSIQEDLKRDMIVTEVKDNYGKVGTIFFSIKGSPPKARAMLILNTINEGTDNDSVKTYAGTLYVIRLPNLIYSESVELVMELRGGQK